MINDRMHADPCYVRERVRFLKKRLRESSFNPSCPAREERGREKRLSEAGRGGSGPKRKWYHFLESENGLVSEIMSNCTG